MLKNENVICISSIDWDFIWQGHQEIMSALARGGNRVLFIENTGVRAPRVQDLSRIKSRIKNWFSGIKGIRKVRDNLFVFSPVLLPFPYSRLALWVNRCLLYSVLEKWDKVMNFLNPVVWVFLPTPLSLEIVKRINGKIILYYCIDSFRASSSSAGKIARSETELLKKSDLVFVTSQELRDYCSRYNDNVHLFPFAVNYEAFEKVRLGKGPDLPAELKNIKRPVIGYVGGVHKWIDLELIKKAALRYPEYSFVFIGPVQTDVSMLSGLKNIHFLGKAEHDKVPFFIKYFDICVIPYLITEYTKNVYPTKLNEYLAMGKPVLATDLPEIRKFNQENNNLVYVGRDEEEFIGYLSKVNGCDNNETLQKRLSVAKNNGWARRIEQMSGLIEESIDKKSGQAFDWKKAFLRLYASTRKKTLKLLFVAISLYIIVFYTPLFWLIASPLKISQAPQKADCIVVFAGGTGESGKAGQGYEERVGYAVELYKKGYASRVIFSSGYMFFFKEPVVMKALAVSLGVPQEAIILEDKASGTYQNVRFTRDILLSNGWNRILLVSSPYHMRRAALVFNKIAGNIKVSYTPLPNALFYSHPERDEHNRRVLKRINTQQIRGILHEYLGILYYWFKGYI